MRSWILVSALAGCIDVDFNTNATSIQAIGQSDGNTLVDICAGPSGLLDCNEDKDTFHVSVGSDTEVPSYGLLSFGMLSVVFATNATDTMVVVTRDRDGGRAVASLPPPFEITDSVADNRVTLTWQSTDDHMQMTPTVTCGSTSQTGATRDIDNNGELTVDVGDLEKPADGICEAEVALTRTRDGSLDATYEPKSRITGEQQRIVRFQLD